jgi:hypothetical protein
MQGWQFHCHYRETILYSLISFGLLKLNIQLTCVREDMATFNVAVTFCGKSSSKCFFSKENTDRLARKLKKNGTGKAST